MKIRSIAIVLSGVSAVAAVCDIPWKGPGSGFFCRKEMFEDCVKITSGQDCLQPSSDGPFLSGYADANVDSTTGENMPCTIWSKAGCRFGGGQAATVNQVGLLKFPFTVKSVECPCI
ncbi:hypothetical protein DFQ27_004134 [Actinomortierella ambigua]|uniref:Uncharacterized protein n=1 Tax=Actinomortierella ambigua TaxID=1343610 RepID=A0A9P6QL16_9FUNG|nr:hypothetical protein DFQ27_004134 [Actinomortierella ambigua]